MTTTPQGLPDGEMFMMSDRELLVDSVQAVTAQTWKIGDEPEVHVLFTAQGKLNHRPDREDVTLVLNRSGVLEAIKVLTHQLPFLPEDDD